jgi:hypothetical protein
MYVRKQGPISVESSQAKILLVPSRHFFTRQTASPHRSVDTYSAVPGNRGNINEIFQIVKKKKLRNLSPRANYTD